MASLAWVVASLQHGRWPAFSMGGHLCSATMGLKSACPANQACPQTHTCRLCWKSQAFARMECPREDSQAATNSVSCGASLWCPLTNRAPRDTVATPCRCGPRQGMVEEREGHLRASASGRWWCRCAQAKALARVTQKQLRCSKDGGQAPSSSIDDLCEGSQAQGGLASALDLPVRALTLSVTSCSDALVHGWWAREVSAGFSLLLAGATACHGRG